MNLYILTTLTPRTPPLRLRLTPWRRLSDRPPTTPTPEDRPPAPPKAGPPRP
ncbi:hypothetical protein ACIBU0_16475 [Streptomyces sp. NPDC049627]|uniref:hypothetical protein n=1 Tax=Streptomyces sp. NPDC049627 TaxID=3365595 RepID=UPI00379297F5